MATDKITTPRGQIVIGESGEARIDWNPNFAQEWNKKYDKAQVLFDNSILKDTDKYVPMRTGMLRLSSKLGTVIGQGLLRWIAPYSKWQYYRPNKIGSETGALRGPRWFERSKADNKDKWISSIKGEFKK